MEVRRDQSVLLADTMNKSAQRRSISAAIALVEEWLESVEHYNRTDSSRLARCVIILLTAHIEAHLTEQDDD